MKAITNTVGILLIIIGIVTLAYKGFTYTKHEPVAQVGNVEVVKDTTQTVYISPLLGILSLASGIVLVVIARRGDKS